jgi:hypothetical protein
MWVRLPPRAPLFHRHFSTIKNRVYLKKSHLFPKITFASGLQFKLYLILRGIRGELTVIDCGIENLNRDEK